jgi:hypothetical protein
MTENIKGYELALAMNNLLYRLGKEKGEHTDGYYDGYHAAFNDLIQEVL